MHSKTSFQGLSIRLYSHTFFSKEMSISVIHSRVSFCISWWCFVDKNQPLHIISLKYTVKNHVHCVDGAHAGRGDKQVNILHRKATLDTMDMLYLCCMCEYADESDVIHTQRDCLDHPDASPSIPAMCNGNQWIIRGELLHQLGWRLTLWVAGTDDWRS